VDFVDGARTMTAKRVDAMSGQLFTLEQNAIVKVPAFSLIEPPAISIASSETSKMGICSSVWWVAVLFINLPFNHRHLKLS
jgi:hypothetical protein